MTLDLRQRIRYCSPAMAQATGFAPHELVREPLQRLRHPDMPMRVMRELWEALEAGVAWVAPFKLACKDGGHCWARASFAPVVDRHGGLSIVVVLTRPGAIHVRGAEALYAAMRNRTTAWLETLAAHRRELPDVLRW
nr:PAS domain-containing protein [Aquabacterium terrae]